MMYRFKAAAAMAVLSGALVCAQAWQNLYPSYTGLAFGGGNFVAVSSDGLIKTGDGDGSWGEYFLPTRGMHSAAYGDGFFVVTHNGIGTPSIFRSEDGRAWGPQAISGNEPCRFLTFGEGNFVGINEEGWVFSFDGDDWDGFGSAPTISLSHAAFGAGSYVAVGNNIIWSAPGTVTANVWRAASASTPGGVSVVAFGDDRFVAIASGGSAVYTSDNGQNWTNASSNAPEGMADMTFGDGKFVAVGSAGRAAVSSDGSQWSVSVLNANDNFVAVKYGNNRFVALGARGSVYTSPDGASWSKRSDGRLMSYRQIVYGGGKFVAVGDSGVSVSGDGKDWVRKDIAGRRLNAVAFGAGRFVAVGDSGAIFSSSDGESWESHSRTDGTTFTSVAFGNDIFMAGGMTRPMAGTVGNAAIYTSADGQQGWLDRSSDAQNQWAPRVYPTSIAFGGGKFIAGTVDGTIMSSTSADGRYWASAATPANTGSGRIISMVYAGDRFVGLGTTSGGATLITSTDGGDWTSMPAPPTARSATFAKGAYVIAADTGNIYMSSNGSDWGPMAKATNKNLTTVYFDGGNTLLAGGVNGALLYSSETPVSIRHITQSPNGKTSPKTLRMTMERTGRTPAVTLSFAPEKAGTIAVYSLTGKRIYKRNVGAGESIIQLPGRFTANGSVIVKYSGGDGKTVVQRFSMVK